MWLFDHSVIKLGNMSSYSSNAAVNKKKVKKDKKRRNITFWYLHYLSKVWGIFIVFFFLNKLILSFSKGCIKQERQQRLLHCYKKNSNKCYYLNSLIYYNENSYSKIIFHNITVFYCIFDQICKCSLGEHKRLLSKPFKNLTDPKHLNGSACSFFILTFHLNCFADNIMCNKTKLNKMINRGILIVISVFGPHCIIIKESSSFMVHLAYVSVCECLCECVWAYGACAGRGRGAGQGHHLLNGQSSVWGGAEGYWCRSLSGSLCLTG